MYLKNTYALYFTDMTVKYNINSIGNKKHYKL